MDLKKYIGIYDKVFPLKTLSIFLKYINTLDFEDAAVVGNNKQQFIRKDIRNTKSKALSRHSSSMTEVHWQNLLIRTFAKTFNHYSQSFGLNESFVNDITDIQILKYKVGGFYKYHVDHCKQYPRTLSGILLLNNDYEGGELSFRNLDKTGEEIIPVEPNRMIVWPSNFLFPHTVKPVKKGTRYSVVAWGL
jgi:predicted 2-oxoglutarate/Fe(II)-dependent dioxygenase YbiX